MNKTGQSLSLWSVFNFVSGVRQAAPTPRSETLDIIGQGAAWLHIVQFCQVKIKRLKV